MKVQEAIDQINKLDNWSADVKQVEVQDSYGEHPMLIVHHDTEGFANPVFKMLLDQEDPDIVWTNPLISNGYKDNFFALYTVATALFSLRKTLPKNRGIVDPLFKIRVLPGSNGYLNANFNIGSYIVGTDDSSKVADWRTRFTEHEISQLKQQADVAVDWDKAKLEPADDDEQD